MTLLNLSLTSILNTSKEDLVHGTIEFMGMDFFFSLVCLYNIENAPNAPLVEYRLIINDMVRDFHQFHFLACCSQWRKGDTQICNTTFVFFFYFVQSVKHLR